MDENKRPLLEEQEGIDLLEIALLFRQKLKFIILFFVLGAVLAGCYSKFFITPTYTATAKIYLVSASRDSVVNLSDLQLSSNLAADYKELILSRPVLESVVKNLDLSVSPSALRRSVSILNTGSSRILSIRATSPNPQLSANIANEFARQAVNWLPEVMETNAPNIAEEAVAPSTKSAPNNKRNALTGAVLAAVLYCGFFVVQHLLDDTVKSSEDVERYFGVMPLAAIPEEAELFHEEPQQRKPSRLSTLLLSRKGARVK